MATRLHTAFVKEKFYQRFSDLKLADGLHFTREQYQARVTALPRIHDENQGPDPKRNYEYK